jgi:hypothetical protein
MNETFGTYAPTLDAAEKLIGIAISAGLFWLAHRANGIAKSNLELAKQERENQAYRISRDERELFRNVYSQIIKALTKIHLDKHVSYEAKMIFWEAFKQAELELPDDIKVYMKELYRKITEAHNLYYFDLHSKTNPPNNKDKELLINKHEKILFNILDDKPFDFFAPHMKIKTS